MESQFVPGFEKLPLYIAECREVDVKKVFHHPVPSSSQSALLPECLG